MEDKIIELADYFISESNTYREAKIACEKLLKQVSHEIELRAMESEIPKQKKHLTKSGAYQNFQFNYITEREEKLWKLPTNQ